MPKRINKSKHDIVSDIQLVQDADRRRSLVRDDVFPYLVTMNDTIGYSKVFLQAFSALVDGAYSEQRKTTTLLHILPEIEAKLRSMFDLKDKVQKNEFERYLKFAELLKDVSVQDLTYATELSRYIDGFMMKKYEKDKIDTVDILKILG